MKTKNLFLAELVKITKTTPCEYDEERNFYHYEQEPGLVFVKPIKLGGGF